MTGKRFALVAAVLAVTAVGAAPAWNWGGLQSAPLLTAEPAAKPSAANKNKAVNDNSREADPEAVRAAANNFVKAFEKGDAKAVDVLWTEVGEYVENDGATLHGRAVIEDGYAQFFKKNPSVQLEVSIDSIRFVSRDSAVLEGSARSFIRACFTVKKNGKDEILSGTQLIGKDPRSGQLHSWLFESDGGFGDAAWSWDGKSWRLEATGVEPDGAEVTAANLMTPLNRDSFTWQSIDRTVGGEDAPNIPPVKVVRVK